jgi:hypothetical protein
MENLTELRDGPEPDDHVGWQLWTLMNMGYSMITLAAAVRLFLEAPWTTLIVEQQHGTMAALHRYHPSYALSMLVTRTLISLIRRLLPSKTDDEKALCRILNKLGRLCKKMPSRTSGRHMFFKDLVELASKKGAATSVEKARVVKKIMKFHGGRWKVRSLASRRVYDLLARRRIRVRHQEIADEMKVLRASRIEVKARVHEAS